MLTVDAHYQAPVKWHFILLSISYRIFFSREARVHSKLETIGSIESKCESMSAYSTDDA